MDWLQDAQDTLDTVLTYGGADDPHFDRIINKYREMALDLGRADEFERVMDTVITTRARRRTGSRAQAD